MPESTPVFEEKKKALVHAGKVTMPPGPNDMRRGRKSWSKKGKSRTEVLSPTNKGYIHQAE